MATLLIVIYIAFISLGLPDSILGSVWPRMQADLNAELAVAGYVSMIITCGTVVSSLLCDWTVRKLGTGRVTTLSVAMTALALLGFATAPHAFWLLLWAVPLGLGAGSIDSALNNYVALHYEARHMNWLHCFWGIGASTGPLIVSAVLRSGGIWRMGYGIVFVIQLVLFTILLVAGKQWAHAPNGTPAEKPQNSSSTALLLHTKGIRPILASFILYSACESTAGLWGTTFLHQRFQLNPADAAIASTLFYGGITTGRGLSGFGARRFSEETMIRFGLVVSGLGLTTLLLSPVPAFSLCGFAVLGAGLAPIFPAMLHVTPRRFGADRSQSVIGLQMAFAYVGSTALPPLFGILADRFSVRLFPWFMLALAAALAFSTERSKHFSHTA